MNIKPSNAIAADKSKARKEKSPPKKITETYLHNAGLYYLQRFAASSHQFRDVMIRKARKSCMHHKDQNLEDCIDMIDVLVQKFQEINLLDDDAYARGVVNSMRRQGKSHNAVLHKLRGKGFNADFAHKKLTQHAEENSHVDPEMQAALIFIRKKRLGPYKKNDKDHFEKSLSAMARAGFKYNIAQRVLNFDLDEAEALIQP